MNQAPQTVALWQQLQAVAQALVQVRQGTSASVVVAAVPPPLRAGVQALLFQVLRQLTLELLCGECLFILCRCLLEHTDTLCHHLKCL